MVKIGFHASHEIYSPRELLELVELAARKGFDAASCSDHFHPWSTRGQSGFAWSWLGSALERTELDFGTVCAPGQRYHPAIIAQAAATLAQMYPERFWVALGTGQNLNEHITGDHWSSKKNRQQRLRECVDIMRRLWNGETVTHVGLVNVKDARLYTLPDKPPLIFGAAITEDTAEWVGSWADGLLTVAKPREDLAKMVAAFHRGGGKGKPMRLQGAISLESSGKAAFANWGVACLGVSALQDIATPEQFDNQKGSHQPSDILQCLRISEDLDEHIQWLRQDLELGFEAIYLHYVGEDIRNFIDRFGRIVLPTLLTEQR